MKKLLLLLLLIFPAFVAAEEQVPPNWTYSQEQLDVINQYGPPHLFAIVQIENGMVRYETWYYFGLVRKQYGFSNGKKVRDEALGILLNLPAPQVQPNQFTFSTTRVNLGNLFGPPSSVVQGQVPGVNQQTLSYTGKGVSVWLHNGKVTSVVTFPAL
jgi:hypothetical protein